MFDLDKQCFLTKKCKTELLLKQSLSEKTETISLRLDKSLLVKIRLYAKNENISLNSMINRSLSHVMEWDVLASKVGWIPFSKEALMLFIEKLSEREIITISEKAGLEILKNVSLRRNDKIDPKEWLLLLKNRTIASNFQFDEIDGDENVSYILQHNMGWKYSKYFEAFYRVSFTKLGIKINITTTDNIVRFVIQKEDLFS
jgi:hypothetical protein